MSINNKQRYCIVSGLAGFNDFFNAFFKACEKVEYGLKQNVNIGIVVHWMGMSDEFWDFFEPTDRIKKITNINSILVGIDKLKPFVFTPEYSYDKSHIAIKNTQAPEAINWNDDSWDFLTEGFTGQWNYSDSFFKYLKLGSNLRSRIKNLIDTLDRGDYFCLNFRMQEYIKAVCRENTEEFYNKKFAEYSDIIEKTISDVKSKILLCTDDVRLVAKFVDNKKIFSFGYAKNFVDRGMDLDAISKNQGIHLGYHNKLGISKRELCLFGFTDYFLMAMSKTLVPAEFGYFGRAAKNLKEHIDKNKNIKELIYEAN